MCAHQPAFNSRKASSLEVSCSGSEFCRDSVFSKHAKFRRAEPDEKELILYEQIKKKCRNMEKTFEEINAEGKANGQLLKIPYAATKKMFTESKSG